MLLGKAALNISEEMCGTYPGALKVLTLTDSVISFPCFNMGTIELLSAVFMYTMASGVTSGPSFTAIFHTQ